MSLQQYVEQRKSVKPVQIMAHVVCGYPSFEDNMRALEIMAANGVDVVELQFPFSEPSADGPLFVHANELSLKSGTTVDQCFEFMAKVTQRFPFKVLMMGYYNTVFKMGEAVFVERLKAAGGAGYIVPDLPVEEAGHLHALSKAAGVEPIILMTPTTSDQRMAKLAKSASGLVYVVARKGVTGTKTEMGDDIRGLVARVRNHSDLPIAVGFGISNRADVDYLAGVADMAIIGTAALKVWEEQGEEGYNAFFASVNTAA
jgi:tryptophan synthase alpha chain